MIWIIRTRTQQLKLNTAILADLRKLLDLAADVGAVVTPGVVWLDW